LNVAFEAGTTVAAEGPEQLCVVVGDAVRVPGSPGPEVIAGVVPCDAHVPGTLVNGYAGQEFTVVVGAGVEDWDRAGPGGAVVIGVTFVDLGGAADGMGRVGVDQVAPAVVGTAAPVPGQVGLGIDADWVALRIEVGLDRDEAGVAAADLRRCDEERGSE